MKKKLTLLVSLLVVALMFSVGLAAWIITAPTTESNTQGNINVDTVEMHGWQFVTKWVNKDGSDATTPTINYGTPEDLSAANSWLTNSSVGTENLVAYLSVTITKSNEADTPTDSTVTINVTDVATVVDGTVKTPFASKVDSTYAGYKIEYQTATESEGETTYSYTDTAGKITAAQLTSGVILRISFTWGSKSDYKNPYTYYNGKAYTGELATEAKTYLDAIAALKGKYLQVTLSAE